jgi:hypothetical protein
MISRKDIVREEEAGTEGIKADKNSGVKASTRFEA